METDRPTCKCISGRSLALNPSLHRDLEMRFWLAIRKLAGLVGQRRFTLEGWLADAEFESTPGSPSSRANPRTTSEMPAIKSIR